MSTTSTTSPSHRGGRQPLSTFSLAIDLPRGFTDRLGGESSASLAAAITWLGTDRPRAQNFWPALCLALISQCEAVLEEASQDSDTDPFAHFTVASSQGSRPVNTLNFEVGDAKIALRPRFNHAAEVIRVDMRRDHPSAAAHATQAWPAYRPLIEMIFRMEPAARTRFAEYVWEKGVLDAPERRWATQAERIVRPFEKVLADFDTRNATPGGALFQGLVFGFFSADSPNLTLESHQVNTGSARVDMPGDVAGFRGGEVELAVEVKDYGITESTVESVLVDFLEDLVEAPNTTAVVVADSVDQASRDRLIRSNVIALSREDLRQRVATWDLPKQQEALRGAIYFLSRVQKKTPLVDKLVGFLNDQGISGGIIDQPVLRLEATDPQVVDATDSDSLDA